MEKEKFFAKDLEKHKTKDVVDSHINGSLTVIWRDWDKIIANHPKMVYVSSINPGEIKGPHLHKNRTSYLICIHGKVVYVIDEGNNNYKEIEADSNKPVLICVPKGIASAHINTTSEIARVLVLADIAWKPDDNEMKNVSFSDYNWSKWKRS